MSFRSVLGVMVLMVLLATGLFFWLMEEKPRAVWQDFNAITLEAIDDVTQTTAKPVQSISPEAVYENMQKKAKVVVLDVRTPLEFSREHIQGAVSLPLDEPKIFGPKVEKLLPDKQATIYVLCRTGRRSNAAVTIMMNLGYNHVYNMGGIIDWSHDLVTGS